VIESAEVYNDVHRVADEIIETPEMIGMRPSVGMKIKLSKMSTETAAYQQAFAQDGNYVYDSKSLICILQAE